eukprot:TRINITY_DN7145_c0_g1_i2.p1 TRINITY_DN7145_c0_g1~~TRINITY_DN7145_c0_g1_i2.p1  ORF type:complete len:353 (+),score=82.38 TRINITY_DN7145_c0_g1_i2:47-1060(+)
MRPAALPIQPGYAAAGAPMTSAQGMYTQPMKPPMPAGAPMPGAYGAPAGAPPGAYGAAPSAPGYGVPAAQPYAAQQPYGAPPAQYGAPGPYGAPPAQPYGAPPAQPYGAPAPGAYGAPAPGAYGAPPAGAYGAPAPGFAPGAARPGAVSLVKGGNMSLSKAAPGLVHTRVGLGWDVRQTSGAAFDLDASVFLLTAAGKVRGQQDFIFYNNLQSMDGSIRHLGDNLTGAGEGDDEQVMIDLSRVPPDVDKIVFACTIYEAEVRQQNFGMVRNAFIRVVNADNMMELVRFDLTEEASLFNAMLFGEVYRYGGEWKFRAIGQGFNGGLRQLGTMFGINLV